MNKKIKLAAWLAALAIGQQTLDLLVFEVPKPLADNDISFYQPRSDLQHSLSQINKGIREKKLSEELTIQTGEKSINDEYLSKLRNYHSQLLEMYSLILSKPVGMSVEKMFHNIVRSLEYTNSTQCLLIDGKKDEYTKLFDGFSTTVENIGSRRESILKIHSRIFSVMPELDENGEQSAEAIIERVEIINDLVKDPYLGIGTGHSVLIDEIDIFLSEFDSLHNIYMNCAREYNERVADDSRLKKYISYLFFLIVTILMYWKELLGIKEHDKSK